MQSLQPKGRYYLYVGHNQIPQEQKWKRMWKSNLWPKDTLFIWLLMQWRIFTWENIQKRGFIGPNWCIMCRKEGEHINYLLGSCSFVTPLWGKGEEIYRRWGLCPREMIQTFLEWDVKPFKNLILNHIWELFLGFLLWEGWKERNRTIFEGKSRKEVEVWWKL